MLRRFAMLTPLMRFCPCRCYYLRAICYFAADIMSFAADDAADDAGIRHTPLRLRAALFSRADDYFITLMMPLLLMIYCHMRRSALMFAAAPCYAMIATVYTAAQSAMLHVRYATFFFHFAATLLYAILIRHIFKAAEKSCMHAVRMPVCVYARLLSSPAPCYATLRAVAAICQLDAAVTSALQYRHLRYAAIRHIC